MTLLDGSTAFATDMTLMLGAESYILKNNNLPSDPFGRDCLQTFVDLFLNTEKMYFTLPGTQDKGTPKLITQLGSHLGKFSKGAVQLSTEIEQNVFEGFIKLLESGDVRLLRSLREWLNFQMLNPIVTKGHRYRIHEKGERLVPDESYQIWMERRELVLKNRQFLQNNFAKYTDTFNTITFEYIQTELNRFNSIEDFLLCYLFDTYRRGWQYIEGVRIASEAAGIKAIYFPHALRNHALHLATDNWQTIQIHQNRLWSWGGYIVELINEPEYEQERSPEKVIHYLLAISEAVEKTGCPKWDYETLFDKNGNVKNKKYLKKLHNYIAETADSARLPLLRIQDTILETTLIEKLAHLAIRFVSPRLVIDAKSEMDLRRLTNSLPFYKGTFGYRGLLPKDIAVDVNS
jgi:hypothetical protein